MVMLGFVWYVVLLSAVHSVCLDPSIADPIAFKDGDYIIAGLFNIGNKRENDTTIYCDHTGKAQPYEIQKGLVMRWIVQNENERFVREFNKSIGYVIYDTCDNMQTAQLVAARAAILPKVIGLSSVDDKDYIEETVGITTSTYIPTFIYMYNDDTMLEERRFPSLYSIIDTEIDEAKITIQYLKALGYTYMDIWHHHYSKEMAYYILKEYVEKVGCGRIMEIRSKSEVPKKVNSLYNTTKGSPSQVQLLLSNNPSTTEAQLRYLIKDLGWRNKTYIFGLSNGRRIYHARYIKAIKEVIPNGTSNETLVFPISTILNAQLPDINGKLIPRWTENHNDGQLDEMYRTIQNTYKSCTKEDSEGKKYIKCAKTSWSPYVVTGVKVLLQALYDTLKTEGLDNSDCDEEFKQKVLDLVVTENRTVPLKIDQDLEINATFKHKSIASDFTFEMYRSWTEGVVSVAIGHKDSIEITRPDILYSLPYNKSCSHTCYPGTIRQIEHVKTVPCCWTCLTCVDDDEFSDESNTDHCHHCHHWEIASGDNHTKCENVSIIYISAKSGYFLGGAVSVGVGLLLIAVVVGVVFWNRTRPVIKASEPTFLYVFLLGLAIGFITCITPLFKPTRLTCAVEYYSFILFASLATSNLAWRCGKIYSVFQAANNFGKPKFSILLSIKGQLVLNAMVILVCVGLTALNMRLGYGMWSVDEFQGDEHSEIYLRCTATGSNLAGGIVGIPLLIPLALFFFTLVLAFKMRRFPHNFRETSNIFMATLVVLMTCVMFLSGYNLSPASITPILRAIVFYMTSLAFLVCLFLPKVIVLVKNVDNQEERAKIQEDVRKFSEKSTNRRISKVNTK